MSERNVIRVGSRKSELALIQTKHVISLLKKINPDKEFEIVTMSTLGDKVLDVPLPKIGEKSLFTRELETALESGAVDFVVHSLKDLPTTLPAGMVVGAVLTREDPRDALVLNKDNMSFTLDTLPEGSVIGTSSLRRTAQLLKKYPHLKIESIRGNLNTRLRKLDETGKYSAIILASAGLKRMGWENRISKVLETDELLYAVGQGALAVECKEDNELIIDLLKPIYDVRTALSVVVERSCLKTLGGGCSAPVAVCTSLLRIPGNIHKINARAAVWSLDGKEEIIEDDCCELEVGDTGKTDICASCPFNNNKKQNIEDSKCLKACLFKSGNESLKEEDEEEVPSKRAKVDKVPTALLEDDVHCPIQIPVGADFMGKCPYLESGSQIVTGKCPFQNVSTTNEIESSSKNQQNESTTSNSKQNESSNTFCGLVPYKNVSLKVYKEAQALGEKLAKKLISNGALDIMAKAQEIVHSSITGNIVK